MDTVPGVGHPSSTRPEFRNPQNAKSEVSSEEIIMDRHSTSCLEDDVGTLSKVKPYCFNELWDTAGVEKYTIRDLRYLGHDNERSSS